MWGQASFSWENEKPVITGTTVLYIRTCTLNTTIKSEFIYSYGIFDTMHLFQKLYKLRFNMLKL